MTGYSKAHEELLMGEPGSWWKCMEDELFSLSLDSGLHDYLQLYGLKAEI